MPEQHARLSASASHRWISCPASVLLVEQADLPEESSPYAEEGTRAHTLAEITAARHFGLIDEWAYHARLRDWEAELLDGEADQMLVAADGYVDLLQSIMDENPGAAVLLEQRLGTGVPSCWGTSDAVIIAPGLIHVVDLKYGAGIRVSAFENSQLMLYGVGALEAFDILGEVESVCVTVYQPRLDHTETYCLDAAELREWRDGLIPIAEAALQPGAEFNPSESACRFCPVAGDCSARAKAIAAEAFGEPPLMSPQEMAQALERIADIRRWCQQVEERALSKAYREKMVLPGWKVVRTAGRRSIVDHAAAIQTLIDHGYTAEQVANFSAKPFGELERLVGKKELPEVLGDLIGKSEGRPSLVVASDRRPAIDAFTEEASGFSVIET